MNISPVTRSFQTVAVDQFKPLIFGGILKLWMFFNIPQKRETFSN